MFNIAFPAIRIDRKLLEANINNYQIPKIILIPVKILCLSLIRLEEQ